MAETVSPAPAWALDRRLAGRMVVAWAAALAAAHLVQRGFRPPTALMVLESLVYLAFYVGLVSIGPVRAWLDGIPSPHRLVFAGFVFCATWGQLVVQSRTTFPFVAWTMYARAEPRRLVEYYRYRGIDARGQEVWVDPAVEFTFVNSAEIASRVKYLGRPAASSKEGPRRDQARARVRDLLGALGAAYNRSHPDAPLRSLEFVHYAWDYRTQTPADAVADPVLHIDLPEGAAR